MPRVEISEAAAPVSRAVEKVRLFIIVMSLPFLSSAYEAGGDHNSDQLYELI
jgi:hypothetical protein